jgi:hypothetical protein
MQLEIYRNTTKIATIDVGETATFTSVLMGEHKITARCFNTTPLAVALGDYILHNNEKYYINLVPTVEKIDNVTYAYEFTFEATIYSLYNKKLMDEGAMDFSYTGTAEEHLLLLLENMNSIDTGWSIAEVEETEVKTLTYVNENCRKALSTMAEAFGLEFRLVGKAIYLVKTIAVESTLVFEYGKGKGLYTLTRTAVDDANVVTRVYGFGASRNIDLYYRDGQKKLVFEERFLEANTDIFGIKEGVYNNDEIYPHRQSLIEAIDAEDKTKVIDTTIDFDINDYLLEGDTPEIHFLTGALAGYTFEISNYNHDTKEINFVPFVEQSGYELPNNLNFPEVDDKYTLLGIKMPQSYIDTAESELKAKTAEFLAENSYPTVTYELNIDEKFIRDNNIELLVGQKVGVKDVALGIDNQIRVHRITYPFVNPENIIAEISDFITYTVQEQLIQAQVNTTKETKLIDRNSIELSRRNAYNRKQLQNLIYDVDGYFKPTNIKPLSIETAMLSVGAKSQNFGLNGVVIEPNFDGAANALVISDGSLAHFEIEIEGLGYIWEIDTYSAVILNPAKHYYVYARCSKVALVGTWVLSETPIKAEAETGFYHFNVGVLYAVADGRRDFDFTKGMTFITGDTIKTGTITSLDGLNFISLSDNKFHFGNETSYVDWNNLEAGKLKISDAVIDNSLIATNIWAEGANIGDWKIESGKIVSDIKSSGTTPVIELDSTTGQIRVNHSSGKVSVIDEDGIISNTGNQQVLSFGITAKASVAGLGYGDVEKDLFGQNFLAGVFGRASNSNSNPAPAFGGVFFGLKAYGLHLNVEALSQNITSHTVGDYEDYISCYNTEDATIMLPANKYVGRLIYVKRINDNVTINGNGTGILALTAQTTVSIAEGDCWMFLFDGSYWMAQKLVR